MRNSGFFLNADLGLFIVIAVFLLVGLFNATKLGYIQKKYVPALIFCGVILMAGFLLLR